jgi:hypothetical protein
MMRSGCAQERATGGRAGAAKCMVRQEELLAAALGREGTYARVGCLDSMGGGGRAVQRRREERRERAPCARVVFRYSPNTKDGRRLDDQIGRVGVWR